MKRVINMCLLILLDCFSTSFDGCHMKPLQEQSKTVKTVTIRHVPSLMFDHVFAFLQVISCILFNFMLLKDQSGNILDFLIVNKSHKKTEDNNMLFCRSVLSDFSSLSVSPTEDIKLYEQLYNKTFHKYIVF